MIDLPTLDLDYGVSLDDAELAGGHAGVVARVPDVGQLQHVLADGELRVGGQVPGALPPLHSRNMGSMSLELGPLLLLVQSGYYRFYI